MKMCLFGALGLLVAVMLMMIIRWWPLRPRKSVTIVSQNPTIERLERLSHLVTMRVYLADVLTAEAEGHRGAWLIRGDGLIAVNLARASIVVKDDQTKQAVIRLPTPEVLQARVDHTRTRTWEVRKTTWVPWRGDQDRVRVVWESNSGAQSPGNGQPEPLADQWTPGTTGVARCADTHCRRW